MVGWQPVVGVALAFSGVALAYPLHVAGQLTHHVRALQSSVAHALALEMANADGGARGGAVEQLLVLAEIVRTRADCGFELLGVTVPVHAGAHALGACVAGAIALAQLSFIRATRE